MKSTIQDMKERRACRAYKAEQITEEELDLVLEAGTYAPTGRNGQSPVMVVLQKQEDIEQLQAMNAAVIGDPAAKPFYGAPTVIVVLADKSKPTYLYDGCCVMDNLLNAAGALGLGSCWIHRAKEEFDSDAGKALLKKWGVEGDYEGIGHCILGYRADALPAAPPRKDGYIIKVK